jgi:putative FmdB family regulatory protein
MPTYEYECAKCGSIFEHFQSIKAPKLKRCIEDGCDGKVTRLMGTGGGIIFKGGGFYETDYRSDSYKAGEKAAKDAKDSAKKKSEEKSKSKSKDKGGSKEKSKPAKKPKK